MELNHFGKSKDYLEVNFFSIQFISYISINKIIISLQIRLIYNVNLIDNLLKTLMYYIVLIYS